MSISLPADIEALERVPVEERMRAGSTYGALRDVGDRYGERTALRFLPAGDEREPVRDVRYAALLRDVVRAANLFRALGAGPGDAVSLLLPLVPETFVAMLGAQAVSVANPINFLLAREQLAALLREARCRVLLAPAPALLPGVWAKVESIADDVPTLQTILRVGAPEPHSRGVRDFETELALQPDRPAFSRSPGPDDVASLFHTGGTTSTPKLARHTHGALLLQSWTNAQVLRPGPDEVYFNGLPPFHVGGAHCAGLAPLLAGACVVLLGPTGYRNRAVVERFWSLVAELRPTVVAMVPTSWASVSNEPSAGYDLGSVRLAQAGGAAMPLELARAVRARLAAPFVEGWGMTELLGFGTMNPATGESRISSAGRRVPYLEVITAVVAAGRVERRAKPGEIGRVLARGRQMFRGYVDPAHEREAWVEPAADETVPAWSPGGRWFDTGDLGRFDADGYLWLTGRAKDLIVRSGHNIDPLVIEEALHAHPAVETAAAVGRPDAYAGELPVAFVQLKAAAAATPAGELRDFACERIPERAAVPVEVVVLEQMPLTGVGKVFKPALRQMAARRVFEALVRSLVGPTPAVCVEVGPHAVHGTFARVSVSADAGRERLARVRDELARFAMPHELTVP